MNPRTSDTEDPILAQRPRWESEDWPASAPAASAVAAGPAAPSAWFCGSGNGVSLAIGGEVPRAVVAVVEVLIVELLVEALIVKVVIVEVLVVEVLVVDGLAF